MPICSITVAASHLPSVWAFKPVLPKKSIRAEGTCSISFISFQFDGDVLTPWAFGKLA
jgi:hypothetical protein